MNGLMLHAGASAATLEQVAEVTTPAAEKGWQPIAHVDVINLVQSTLAQRNLTVVSQGFALWQNGMRMFGVLELRNGQTPSDYALTIGVRNSHDKSFAAGAALGSKVFVCDNMAFSGEITFARKHTLNIARDLPQLVSAAIGRLVDLRGWQDKRIAAYKQYEMTDALAHDIIVRSLDRKVIGPMKVLDVLKEYREPRHDDFKPRTAWSLFNAYTEISKGTIRQLSRRTSALHGLMDDVCGVIRPDAALELDGVEDAEVAIN
jgi:hypothetical protein